MEVLQIFLLFLIACFGSANWCYMGDSIMDRPIIISSLVGLVLGDFKAASSLAANWNWRGLVFTQLVSAFPRML